MAAITLGFDPIAYGMAFSADAGAVIILPYACLIAGANPGEVIESSGTNLNALGFLKTDPYGTMAQYITGLPTGVAPGRASGERCECFYTGIVWAVCSAAVTAFTRVGTAAAGKIATATDRWCGLAMGTGGANNELIPVRVEFGAITTI